MRKDNYLFHKMKEGGEKYRYLKTDKKCQNFIIDYSLETNRSKKRVINETSAIASIMTSLKNELIGTWKLLSYIEVPLDGDDSLFPMGQNPYGILMYSPEGYMAVQISKEERMLYKSNDKMMATQEEMVSSLQGYIAFCGKYQIDNNRAVVSYSVQSSLFPNWKDQLQHRKIDFDGDVLYLKSTEPILSNGVYVNSYMTWRRIDRSVDDFVDESILREYSFNN